MSILAQLVHRKILLKRRRESKNPRGQANAPTLTRLCDIYIRDVLSFLLYKDLIKCRQVSVALTQKIGAWQSQGRLPRMVVDLWRF
jgi:hypothetical protein